MQTKKDIWPQNIQAELDIENRYDIYFLQISTPESSSPRVPYFVATG